MHPNLWCKNIHIILKVAVSRCITVWIQIFSNKLINTYQCIALNHLFLSENKFVLLLTGRIISLSAICRSFFLRRGILKYKTSGMNINIKL